MYYMLVKTKRKKWCFESYDPDDLENLISTQTNQKTDIATNNEEDAWMRAKLCEDGSNLFLSFIISSMKIILPKADRGC